MSNESSMDPARAGKMSDLGPLTLTRDGNRWLFTLTAPTEMTLELPPDYDGFLIEKLGLMLAPSGTPTIQMDLRDLPAISSRQLGLMLALQKALAGRHGRLHLTGISAGVRRTLDLTRTAQFFELD